MQLNLRTSFNNPVFFWSLVVLSVIAIIFLNDFLYRNPPGQDHPKAEKHAEQSYTDMSKDQNYIVDIDNLHRVDLYDEAAVRGFSIGNFFTVLSNQGFGAAISVLETALLQSRISSPLVYVYTAVLSILFLYREKQHRIQLKYLQKQEDDLQIQAAKQDNYNIDTFQEFERHKSILEPELSVETFKKLLDADFESVIIKARKITEKVVTQVYSKHFSDDASWLSLDEMLKNLKRKNVINNKMKHYADTARSFGNKVVHHDAHQPIAFTTKDAMLVVNSLLLLIDELKQGDLLDA